MFKNKLHSRNREAGTTVGYGTIVEGKLISETDVHIEGEFRGEIACRGNVIIGEQGVVRGSIEAHELTVAGALHGDCLTRGRLAITALGQVHGDITAQVLLIQDGGLLNGHCMMLPQQDTRAATAKESPRHKADKADMSDKADRTDKADKSADKSDKADQSSKGASSDTSKETRDKSKQAG